MKVFDLLLLITNFRLSTYFPNRNQPNLNKYKTDLKVESVVIISHLLLIFALISSNFKFHHLLKSPSEGKMTIHQYSKCFRLQQLHFCTPYTLSTSIKLLFLNYSGLSAPTHQFSTGFLSNYAEHLRHCP